MKHIDDLFREGLGGYTETPPPPVWEALEERLDNDRKKRPALLYRWPWFVVLSFVALLGSFFVFRQGAGNAVSNPIATTGNNNVTGANTVAETEKATKDHTAIAVTKATTAAGNTSTSKTKGHTGTTHKSLSAIVASHNKPVTTNKGNDNGNGAITEETAFAVNTSEKPAADIVIGYIVKNKVRNNILVAESEPILGKATEQKQELLSSPVEEEEMSFGNTTGNDQKATPAYATNAGKAGTVQHNYAGKNTTVGANTGKKATSAQQSAAVTTTDVTASNKGIDHPASDNASANKTGKQQSTAIATVKKAESEKAENSVASTVVKHGKQQATTPVLASAIEQRTTAPAVKTEQKADAKTLANSTAPTNTVADKQSKEAVATAPTKATTTPKPTEKALVSKPAIKKHSAGTTTALVNSSKSATGEVAVQTTSVKAEKATNKVDANMNTKTTGKQHTTLTTDHLELAAATKKASKPAGIASANSAEINKNAQSKPKKATTSAVPNSDEDSGSAMAATARSAKKQKNKPHSATQQQTATTAKKPTGNSSTTAANATPKTAAKPAAMQPVLAALPKSAVSTSPTEVTPQAKPVVTEAPKAPKDSTVAAAKTTDTTNTVASTTSTDSPKTEEPLSIHGFNVSVKGGIESGFNFEASNKFVIAPVFERKISKKLTLMLQPALKYANQTMRDMSGSQSFYSINSGESVYLKDSALIPIVNQYGQIVDVMVRRNYGYNQTHDSIVKTYKTGGSYFEAELPILLKYSLTSKLSVYGGVNLVYSKQLGAKEITFRSQPISVSHDTFTFAHQGQGVVDPPSVSSVIRYNGNPLSSYSGPMYPSPDGSLLRLGYLLGLSYELKKRWLFDVLVQQGKAKANNQGGLDLNKPLSSTYFRFMLGFRLFK